MTSPPCSGKRLPRPLFFRRQGIASIASITVTARTPIASGGAEAPFQIIPHAGGASAADDKRLRVERRKCHPFLADWRWGYRGRRRSLRRATDSQRRHAILDWYHPSLLFFILATYVLSGIDAILTVTLLEIGAAEEANPFMHWLLAQDVRLFAGVKALVTGVGLVWLTAYSNQFLFNKLRVDRIVYALFAVYSVLIFNQIRMLQLAESVGWPG